VYKYQPCWRSHAISVPLLNVKKRESQSQRKRESEREWRESERDGRDLGGESLRKREIEREREIESSQPLTKANVKPTGT
jgi:hypothetical protein